MDWKRKLTSRKFWSAVASFISMLLVALKFSNETVTRVAALIMAGASVIAYIIGEGMADAASVEQTYYVPELPEIEDEEYEDEDGDE